MPHPLHPVGGLGVALGALDHLDGIDEVEAVGAEDVDELPLRVAPGLPLGSARELVHPGDLGPAGRVGSHEHAPVGSEDPAELPHRAVHVGEVVERRRHPDHVHAAVADREGLGRGPHVADVAVLHGPRCGHRRGWFDGHHGYVRPPGPGGGEYAGAGAHVGDPNRTGGQVRHDRLAPAIEHVLTQRSTFLVASGDAFVVDEVLRSRRSVLVRAHVELAVR